MLFSFLHSVDFGILNFRAASLFDIPIWQAFAASVRDRSISDLSLCFVRKFPSVTSCFLSR